MILKWMTLPLAALALAAAAEAAPLRMWDEVVNRPLSAVRPDVDVRDAGDRDELRAYAGGDATGYLLSWDPSGDKAFEAILLRSEALPIPPGQTGSGTSTLPVPEATTLVFVGLALAGVASGRKLFKR